MANEKGPNIKKKQKCKVYVNLTISMTSHTRLPNFVLMAFHVVSL